MVGAAEYGAQWNSYPLSRHLSTIESTSGALTNMYGVEFSLQYAPVFLGSGLGEQQVPVSGDESKRSLRIAD